MPDARALTGATAIIEPIAAATVRGYRADLRVLDTPSPDWISLRAMTCPARTEDRHRRIDSAAGPGAPRRLAVAWEVEAIAWFVGVMVGGSLLRDAGLVTPHPERTWLRVGRDGLAEGLAVASETPTVPSRPSAARGVIAGLVGPLIQSGHQRAARVLWWHAGDRIADALIWCGQAFAASDDALRIAQELLASGVPYSVPLGTDGSRPARIRRTCCLSRLTADGTMCDGCPHVRKR